MATQTIEFAAPPSQTLTVRLFSAGSDTIVQTASAVTAKTNDGGDYAATFTDVPAGTYRLKAFNAAGTPLARWWVDLTLTTATFQTYEMPVNVVQGLSTAGANAARDAVLNALPSAGYVDGSFGDRWLISDSNQREVKVTGSAHIAADVHEFQADVITAAAIAADAVTEIQGAMPDRLGYTLAILAGACSDAGTAGETYAITLDTVTYTVDYTGLTSVGNRGTTTLSKSP